MTRPAKKLLPLRIREQDFELFNAESRTSCSSVLLLDMSGSMARFGRFLQAKKCAMALYALIKQQYALDTVDLVGFASGAEDIREEQLPLLMPKPVTMVDPVINLRVPIQRLDEAPQHFTNLHMGLLKAKRILARRGGDNKMVNRLRLFLAHEVRLTRRIEQMLGHEHRQDAPHAVEAEPLGELIANDVGDPAGHVLGDFGGRSVLARGHGGSFSPWAPFTVQESQATLKDGKGGSKKTNGQNPRQSGNLLTHNDLFVVILDQCMGRGEFSAFPSCLNYDPANVRFPSRRVNYAFVV